MVNFELEKLADDYFKKGNLFDAEQLYKRVLAADPKNSNALYKLGIINVGKLDYETAEMLLDAALKVGADIKTLQLLAYVKEKRFKLYDAIVMYEQILELAPGVEYYEIIGNLYIQVELYDNAINISKEHVEKYQTLLAYRRLFLLYLNLSMFDELKQVCAELDKLFPNKGLAFNLKGMYKEFVECDYDGAEKMYEKAVKLGVSIAAYDLALCYKKLKKYSEAEKYCKKIINTYPNKSHLLKLMAELEFVQKKMRKGYKYYLERSLFDDIKSLQNKWDGKAYPDKTVLVYFDVPDNHCIKYLRYIPFLKDKFKNVILACSYDFESLLKFNKMKTVKRDKVFNIKYDKYVLLSDLPYYLNMTFENIPKLNLKAQAKDIEGEYKVGLLWKAQGDSMKAVNEQTIDITKYLKELFDIEGVKYYSFQKNDIFNTLEKFPQIQDLSTELNNLQDYAEYIKGMDLIISIDSTVLQLAGAMNVPSLAVLSFDSEWYWFDNDKKTEWYPSIEIVRQKIKEDWTNVSKKIVEKVKNGKHKKTK